MYTDKELLEILKETGALMEGHFKLTSGMHSSNYVQCAKLLRYPDKAEIFAQALAKKFKNDKIELVVGPAIGGIVIAYELARALGVPGIFAEREDNKMTLKRGFEIEKGQRILVAEDVITTGGSVQEVVDLLEELGGNPIGAATIIDRSSAETLKLKLPYKSLLQLEIPVYDEKDCPMCKEGSSPYKPGSRKI